ncbi:hypothetical protein IOD16_03985 [Saccharothrix sp. 6-C]|uniref:hypothetical protein n=1 Tax=Saccharothrix sp. 6-C TaxID=2781735 RepID=UPI00191738BA|nr:hypothetical protein [Saccharothrix sp. 6-C]QQQ77678.1 hypothetical protein IOD16_03985 [Saccharothrix sp. 6-C]
MSDTLLVVGLSIGIALSLAGTDAVVPVVGVQNPSRLLESWAALDSTSPPTVSALLLLAPSAS